MHMTTLRRTSIERPTAASSERCFHARSTLLEALVAASYVEYDPQRCSNIDEWCTELDPAGCAEHVQLHFVLAGGDFVLSVSEDASGGIPVALYDLFRLQTDGRLLEFER